MGFVVNFICTILFVRLLLVQPVESSGIVTQEIVSFSSPSFVLAAGNNIFAIGTSNAKYVFSEAMICIS